MDHREKLDALLKTESIPQGEAFQLFDQLEIAEINFMIGQWKGRELKTGHPMNGLLEASGWYGKTITDSETVDPIVLKGSSAGLYRLNPGLVPFSAPFSLIPRVLARRVLPKIAPLLRTNKPRARIRMLEYRGAVSAAMIYDQIPIIDVFRKVDENTVLGTMDLKGQRKPLFFVLERVSVR